MTTLAPLLVGPLASHPLAPRFAAEVLRVHRRYAAEVVAANRLCPFLRDIDTGLGSFVVVLDVALDPRAAAAAIAASTTQVVHVVYPCVRPPPAVFEKFANRVGAALKEAMDRPPVMATFHPELTGDAGDAYRLIGVLRRAPDPFVQTIPAGLNEGGTVFAGPIEAAPPGPNTGATGVGHAEATFARLHGAALEQLLATLADIHADRARSYAPFLDVMLPG